MAGVVVVITWFYTSEDEVGRGRRGGETWFYIISDFHVARTVSVRLLGTVTQRQGCVAAMQARIPSSVLSLSLSPCPHHRNAAASTTTLRTILNSAKHYP